MQDLRGKTAIITGGAGVLGSAIARGLAAAGAEVGILSRTRNKVDAVVADIQSNGGKAMSVPADVLDRAQLELVRDKVLKEWDGIDILVNCAGGNQAGATIMPDQTLFDLSMADFDAVTRLNLQGTVLPILVFAEVMARQKRGSIINISSMAASRPMTRVFGYAAAKAAIDNATKWLAVELAAKFGPELRVNAVAPGFFVGEQNRDLLLQADGSLTARGETIIAHTPMQRFGDPEDLVGVVNWLAGEGAAFVTGTVIPVDGGFSAFSGV